MDETTLPTWTIFVFVFVWLILPAFIAYLHGRSWFRWLIIGAIFPIVCFIALAILPRPKDQKQKTESDSSTETLVKASPRIQRPIKANLLELDNGKSIGSKDAQTSTIFDLSDQPIGSQEFKIEIASACEESNLTLRGFAEKYNIDPNVLSSWIDEILGADEANSEDTGPTDFEKIGTLGSEDNIEVTQQTEIKVEQKEPGNEQAPQLSVPASITTSGSLSLWLDENQNIEDQLQGVFAMSITNFQVEGPDDDGDISLEIEFKLENTSETEITLVKKTLVLEQSKVGALAGEVNDKEEF